MDIGIIGRSYCGSTVLNYLLGAHSRIFGSSEIARLVDGRPGNCATCGDECPVWTAEAIERARRLAPAELHGFVRRLAGKPVVCDSSKNLGHFKRIGGPMVHVVLTKHPIRHVASFVTNDRPNDRLGYAEERIAYLLRFYERVDEALPALGTRSMRVQYERLVSDAERVLGRILDLAGECFEPSMLDFAGAEQHPFGGNRGPAVQVRRRRGQATKWDPRAEHRRAFYETAQGLRLDDKYREAFSDDELLTLTRSPRLRGLCEQLGYSVDPGVV